ncbi:MAG TPA: GNAT family N-acetyltransferase [Smithellaceae bacterium]|nr:GNAT family N-acetyltransferase [Smithellaceae bacterium]
MDYIKKRISVERQSDLFGLFKSAFGISPTPESLAAKHDTSFTGVRDVGLIAYAPDGQPAGYYGVFPVYVRVNGKKYLIAQSGDTMVHPNHTGKGLFTTLAKLTYDIAKAEKIKGVFGFPSPSSYPGFMKHLEWQHHVNIHRYRFIVPMLPISEFFWRFRAVRRILLAWQSLLFGMFKTANMFPGSLMDGNFDCIDRSECYSSYKLAQPEVRVIRVAGIEAVIKLEGSLGIGDINSTNPRQIRHLIRQLKIICFFSGIHRINTYLSPDCPLDRALGKLASPARGLPIGYVDFSKQFSQRNVLYCYLDMDTF